MTNSKPHKAFLVINKILHYNDSGLQFESNDS